MPNATHSLKSFNTLGLDIGADEIIEAESAAALKRAWDLSQAQDKPFLLLGGGSNVLFLNDFQGIVAINRIKGIQVTESDDYYDIYVGGGENWHQLVVYCLENNIRGLENLALIPGVAGSAPVQNIGAYGIELKDVCHSVDVLNLATGEQSRLDNEQCRFGYRDSIFKHELRQGYAVIALTLRLSKQWQPRLGYGDLSRLDETSATARQVFETVCEMRRSKLPDPEVQGNVGSFFKNPVISLEQRDALLANYPGLPQYPQPDGKVKLAAGWLIDQCQLKGYELGGAAVHRQQALVLINHHQATPQDIVGLAKYVRQSVGDKFGIWLEPEVRFIGAEGECDAVGAIS